MAVLANNSTRSTENFPVLISSPEFVIFYINYSKRNKIKISTLFKCICFITKNHEHFWDISYPFYLFICLFLRLQLNSKIFLFSFFSLNPPSYLSLLYFKLWASCSTNCYCVHIYLYIFVSKYILLRLHIATSMFISGLRNICHAILRKTTSPVPNFPPLPVILRVELGHCGLSTYSLTWTLVFFLLNSHLRLQIGETLWVELLILLVDTIL